MKSSGSSSNNNGNTIQVALRKRPLQAREIEKGRSAEIVEIVNDKQINLLDADEVNRKYSLEYNVNKNRFKETHFSFDAVFDEEATNNDVYSTIAAPLIKDLLEGINTTFFAYGATGAGKTYTMIGQKDVPGLMDLMLEGLFESSQQKRQTHDVKIRFAYMEIYNENLKDLLSPDSKNLDLREDPKSDITLVHGLTEVEVSEYGQIGPILRNGNRNRQKDSTITNEASSRSHAILQIQVECFDRGEGLDREIVTSKLSLVDLAGSEKAWANKSKANKLEGAKINQSLLSLGNCIQALSEISEKGIHKNSFVPFRGSKLTRLLKDSLGGNCRTVMIANISGSILSFEDTYNTLQYANRAKNIKLQVQKNVIHQGNHVANYAVIIEKLNRENDNLRGILNNEKVVGGGGRTNSVGAVGPVADKQSHQIIEQQEQMIKAHFDEEINVLWNIQETQMKLDKLLRANQSYMSKNNTSQSENLKHLKDQLLVNNQGIMVQQSQLNELKHKYSQMQEQRRFVQQRIRQAQLSGKGSQLLANVYAIREMSSENLEKQFNAKILDNKIRERDLEIASLADQLQLREHILLQQKQLMKQHDLQSDPRPQVIKEASLILATVAPNAIGNTQTNNNGNLSTANNSLQNPSYSVDSITMHSLPTNGLRVISNNRRIGGGGGLNRSTQERGGQRNVKSIMSLIEVQGQYNSSRRVVKQRNLSTAQSQESLQKSSQSPPGSQSRHKVTPYIPAAKRGNVNIIGVRGNGRKLSSKKVNTSGSISNNNVSFANDESIMNQSNSDMNNLFQGYPFIGGGQYYANVNQNRYTEHIHSASTMDEFGKRKRNNQSPNPARLGSQKHLPQPSGQQSSLPQINQRKNYLEFDVHQSPYVKAFKNPENPATARQNKLMQLNLNLDQIKEMYTKKYFASP